VIAIALGGISPVLADCCSSVWDCGMAVVTDGVSCEIETILSTIRNLQNLIKNLGNDITGQTQEAERGARQFVSDTISSLQSQSQQSTAGLAAAQNLAESIYKQETTFRDTKTAIAGNSQSLQRLAPTTPSSPSRTPTGELVSQQPGNTRVGTLAVQPAERPVQASAAPGNPLQKSSVTADSQATVSLESTLPPHGSFADAFSRGVKLISSLKSTGDSESSQVSQYLATAQQTEGPGVAAADTLAGAINAPITSIESELDSLLSNPLNAFDPTSAVQSIEDSVKSNLSGNISQMIDDITTGPNQAFGSATPICDDLVQNAQTAQVVAAAMDRLYKLRTPGAAEALYALLPKQEFSNLTTKATAPGTLNSNLRQRQSSPAIAVKYSTFKQKALLSVKAPNLDAVHAALAQVKAQRLQGKSAQSPSMVQTYRNNFSRQLDGYFNGKSPAAILAQRDQLVAQARTHFAKDPSTGDKVIGLINSEAEKPRTARNTAIPGQPVPATTSPTGMSSSAAATTLPSAAMTAPAAARIGAKPQIGLVAPATAPANVTTAPAKPAAWGATPAWTPPAAAGAPAMTAGAPSAPHVTTAVKPTIALKLSQPVQRPPPQPAVLPPAPSSITAP
jgi:hypothetical protein